jgi:hypothetical protein
MFVFVDESIHPRGGFIIVGLVFCKQNPNDLILNSLIKNGFKSDDEFKSGISYTKNPKMSLVRNALKRILFNQSDIAIIVLPINKKDSMGLESLKGLKQFINANNITSDTEVYFDQNFFRNRNVANNLTDEFGFDRCHFNFEQNSKEIRGIQLADLVAHTSAIMLLESLGLIDKNVRAGENSGYDPETEINIGFELWASIRYSFFHKPKLITKDSEDDSPIFDVIPNGLYISEFCDKNLSQAVIDRFGTVYLGCIH